MNQQWRHGENEKYRNHQHQNISNGNEIEKSSASK
jgi:hypothetical protein